MKMFLTRRNVFFLYLSLFTLGSICCFSYEFNIPHTDSLFNNTLIYYSIFDLFLCELFILLFIGQLLIYRNSLFRALLYTLSFIFIVIYYIQLISTIDGKEFLSRIAIENADHVYLFLNYQNIFALCLILLTCFFLLVITENSARTKHPSITINGTISLFILTAISLTCSSSFWLPDRVIVHRNDYLSNHSFDHTGPIYSFISIIFFQEMTYSAPLVHKKFKQFELGEMSKFGFNYDPTKNFPLIKQNIYTEKIPFLNNSEKSGVEPNVIVIFSEGISARVIGSYGCTYPDLTPNIDDFANSSMIVRRYYNHTAATYRGLHGQLCSLFPVMGGMGGWHSGGAETIGSRYLSLADLFNRQGYESIFLDSHHQDHPSRVDDMMTRLGFDSVISGDVLADKYLHKALPLGEKAYSDRQYFDSIVGYLKERVVIGKMNEPFFMSLYNFGTHAFLKNSKDGIRYGAGQNSALNNIHNFDHAFGRFWNYVKSSPYSKNTIIIFTSDHSHYHDKSFVAAFDEPDYQKFFIDKIPLIIHDPSRILPEEYDAEISSSIDLTPTLAHYFGLENTRNPFMGTSIFERQQKTYPHMATAALGPNETFLIDEDRIHKLGDPSKHRTTLEILNDFIRITRQLEIEDRIWDGNYSH